MTQSLTLAELQARVKQMVADKGFDGANILLQTVMMAEEMGEVAKAVRNLERHGKTAENQRELGLELADLLNYVCWLATHYGVNLDNAIEEKFAINATRTWPSEQPKKAAIK